MIDFLYIKHHPNINNNNSSSTFEKKSKDEFKTLHNVSSPETFKMFFRSMDSSMNQKIQTVFFFLIFFELASSSSDFDL